MTDVPKISEQAAFAAKISSLSKMVAKKIALMSSDQREDGLLMVRRSYAARLAAHGLDNEHGHKWLESQIRLTRCLLVEIDEHGADWLEVY